MQLITYTNASREINLSAVRIPPCLFTIFYCLNQFNNSGIYGIAIYKNIHMSLCNRPICYETFVTKYITHSASTKIR
jgi:hypothetical protein